MNTNAMAGTSRVFGPNLDLINQFQGFFFLQFLAISGPNLTFFMKIRWLDGQKTTHERRAGPWRSYSYIYRKYNNINACSLAYV